MVDACLTNIGNRAVAGNEIRVNPGGYFFTHEALTMPSVVRPSRPRSGRRDARTPRNAGASEAISRLLIMQSLDRVQAGGLPGWIKAENDADAGGDEYGHDDGRKRGLGGPVLQ